MTNKSNFPTLVRLLESAANSFESVFLSKPGSSKAGNSELYLVMINYSGSMSSLARIFTKL